MSHCPWIEDVALCVGVLGRSAWVFTQFRPFLAHVHLKLQLIQNLWNSLEINKI